MVNRGLRLISSLILMGLAGFMWAGIASQSPQTVFKPDYQLRCPCDHTIAEILLAYPQAQSLSRKRIPPSGCAFFLCSGHQPWQAEPMVDSAHGLTIRECRICLDLSLPRSAVNSGWRPSGKLKNCGGRIWGLAVNGDLARSQCHAHVHIGKLLDGVEGNEFLFKAASAGNRKRPSR